MPYKTRSKRETETSNPATTQPVAEPSGTQIEVPQQEETTQPTTQIEVAETENTNQPTTQIEGQQQTAASVEIQPSVSDFNNLITMAKFNYEAANKIIPTLEDDERSQHRFLMCCDMVIAELADETEKGKFFNFLPLKLTGEQYDLVRYGLVKSYEELKAKLLSSVKSHKAYEVLMVELINSHQKYPQTATEFGTRLTKLLSLLNEAAINKISATGETAQGIRTLNESVAINTFKYNLTEPIRTLICTKNYTNLMEAVNAAETEEVQLSTQRAVHRQAPFQKKLPSCTSCKKPGHTSEKCRSKLKCTRCGRDGHTDKTCYARMTPIAGPSTSRQALPNIKREPINTVQTQENESKTSRRKPRRKSKNVETTTE